MTLRKNKISRKLLSKRILRKNRKHTRSQNGGSGPTTGLTTGYMPRPTQSRTDTSSSRRQEVANYANKLERQIKQAEKAFPNVRGGISRASGVEIAGKIGQSGQFGQSRLSRKPIGPLFNSFMKQQPPQEAPQPSQAPQAPRAPRASQAFQAFQAPRAPRQSR